MAKKKNIHQILLKSKVQEKYKIQLQLNTLINQVKYYFIIRYFTMQEEFVTLKWGDIVRIHGVNISKKKSTKGLIISKGFTDANIYYQIYNEFQDVNFYRESLFQVLPRVNFDMHDQLLQQDISQEVKQNLRTRAQGELLAFDNALSMKAGKQIKYGSQVIFRHIESKSYIYGMMQAANSGQGAFKIQVTEHLSSSVIFKLVSPRTFENQNDIVYYNDALKVYHPSSDSFMNFSQSQQPIYLDLEEKLQPIPQQHPFRDFSRKRPFIKKPITHRTFIMNQNKSKCFWKFIQHCSYDQFINKQKIKSHDIVYFKHTKKNEESLVSTTISEPLQSYLKQNQQQGALSYECFWELIPQEVNESGPEDCDVFWARNIVTGQLLQFNDFNVKIATSGKSEGKGFDNRGFINLICSENQDPKKALKLEREHQIVIETKIPPIEALYEAKSKKYKFQAVPILPKDIFMIYKVDEQMLQDAMFVITAHQSLVKFVQKLSSGLIQLQKELHEEPDYPKLFLKFQENQLADIVKIQKMLAGKIYNTDFDNIVASGNTPNQNVQRILVQTGIVQILIQILNHLYEPFRFIQRHSQPSQDRAIRVKMLQIFEYTYKLLEKVAANLQLNRIYISRWMDMLLEHSNNVNKSYIQQCIVGILQNNSEAISATINEQKIKNLINNFFHEANQTQQGPLTTKYLRLFSTFIVCENSVIKQNQNIILDHFFKNPANQFNFKFKVQYKNQGAVDDQNDPFKVKSKEVLIAFGSNAYIPFSQFFQVHNNKWNYLMAYINLLADICRDRNNIAIESVTSILSLQAVAVILFDAQILGFNEKIRQQNKQASVKNNEKKYTIENVHQPFIRIAHHVYVDNHKFQQIKRIMRISQWYRSLDEKETSNNVEDINRTKRVFEGQKQQQEYRYLQSILQYIKNYIKQCNQDVTNLNMLNIILSLLKSTVILGLWRSIKSFRQLAPQLMLKISKIQNNFFFEPDPKIRSIIQTVQKNKEKLKMNRPQIALGIQCKIRSIQIFKYVNDLEIDIRVRYIMNFFKGLYDSNQNFNLYDLPLNEQLREDANQQQSARNQTARQQYLKMQGKALFGDQVNKMSEDIDIMLKENVWFNKLKELTPFQYEKQTDPMKDRYIFQGDSDPEKQGYAQQLKQQFSTMVLGLFELSSYQNEKLLNSSLNMLRIMFEQRKDLLINFRKVLICGKGNLEQVYLTLKFMREKFNMLANNNILEYEGDSDKAFPYQIKKPYDYLIKDRQKRSGIVQDLFFLSRTLKDGTSLRNIQSLMEVDEDIFYPNQVYSFINQKQKNNPLFQSLNLAEGIYKPLFQYIKIIGDQSSLKPNHRKLLLSIYQYLTLLCFNNLQAKQILMPYIEFILPHLKNKVGAASFLYQVTRNNKILVCNEQMVNLIIIKSLQSCQQLELSYAISSMFNTQNATNNDYQKSRILFALRGVLLYNDQGHKRNQQFLMNKLQNNRFSKLIFQDTIHYKSTLNDFNLGPQETFIAYHFELFAALVESGNMINIGKLQNLHPYEYCLQILENTNRWELRRSIRSYINRLYYVNKDKDIFLFEKFISKQFQILNTELGDLVELHSKKLISQDLKLKNGIRFCYAQSQIFLFIIQCLITIHEMFLKKEFLNILDRELKKDAKNVDSGKPLHEILIKLFRNLGSIKRIYDKVKIIDPFLRQVYSLLCGVLRKMPVRYLEKKAEPEDSKNSNQVEQQTMQNNPNASSQVQKKSYTFDHSKSFFRNLCSMIKFLKTKQHMDKLKQRHQQSKKQVNVPEEELKTRYLQTIFSVPNRKLKPYLNIKPQPVSYRYDPHLQTANSRIFKVLAKPDLQQNEQNIQLNNKLNEVKTMIEDSPTFDKFKDDQFIFFVNKTLELDNTSIQQYKVNWEEFKEQPKPVISVNEIFTKIFKLIMSNPDKIDDQQKIFVIKLVRCFITEAVEGKQLYKRSVDKWDADYFNQDQVFSERQEQIQSCGGSDFIISIFKQNLSGRVQLLNQVLLLGIAYLYGGNHTCQNSILASLKKDQQNVMMINIKYLIKNIGDFLIASRKIKENEKKRNFAYNIVDTYDYFNPEDKIIMKYFSQTKVDKYEVQLELDNEKALCRIFRFLQLFCQNNNIEMKRFLSLQINEDGSTKTNTINFIEQSSILLKKIFKIMNNKLVMIPNNLLAFIGEITQVPILENQISFIKSTFFEDISYMASFFDSTTNKLQRKFNPVAQDDDDPLNTLSDIYKQAVGLALGNFQGNQFIIINQFLNKCQPKFLWLIIRDQLWTLIKNKYQKMSFVEIDERGDTQSRKKTFNNINSLVIQNIIQEQKKQLNFQGPLASIIEVLIILRKIEDFARLKEVAANEDKQNPNNQDAADAVKARQFKQLLIQTASEELNNGGNKSVENTREVFLLLNQLILQIQINCHNGRSEKLQNLYFCNHPVFQYLAGTTKDSIMVQVTRQTARDKLISLLNFRQEVYEQVKWNFKKNFNVIQGSIFGKQYSKSLPITSPLCQKVRKVANYFSYIIIIMMAYSILAEHVADDELTTFFTYSNMKEKFVLGLVCKFQLVLMILYLILWYILRGQLAFKKYMKNLQSQQSSGESFSLISFIESGYIEQKQKQLQNLPATNKWRNLKIAFIIFLKITFAIIKYVYENRFTSYVIQKISNAGKAVYNKGYLRLCALFSESEFKSIMFFLITSILGNFTGIQWYTTHLFSLFVGIPELINVFKAIINNIYTLFILSLLATAFVFVFNVLSLNTYTPVIYEDQLPKQACQSIFGCVLVVYTSGAIGDDMDEFKFNRFFFDIIYVVFMELLFQNLVGGIMIDAYTSLTADDKARDEDKKGKCYICSMQKPDIEKLGETFKKHTQRHFLWNYIYYIYCLQNKDPTDFTGIQYIISTKIGEEDVSWFPSIQSTDSDGEVQKLMNQLKAKLQTMKINESKIIQKSSFSFDQSSKKIQKLPIAPEAVEGQMMEMIE